MRKNEGQAKGTDPKELTMYPVAQAGENYCFKRVIDLG